MPPCIARHLASMRPNSPSYALQREYWAAFLECARSSRGAGRSNKMPQSQYYMNFPIDQNNARLNVAMIRPRSQIRVAINLCGMNAELYFRLRGQLVPEEPHSVRTTMSASS